MQAFPLIYRFSAVIVNDRFRAQVRGTGHALAVFEDDRWWCSGVEPGGLLEPGTGPVSAYLGFRKTLGQILEQLAEDGLSVEDFAERAARFFAERRPAGPRRWLAAVDSLRQDELAVDRRRRPARPGRPPPPAPRSRSKAPTCSSSRPKPCPSPTPRPARRPRKD